jgi:voltage-gated potassium channel
VHQWRCNGRFSTKKAGIERASSLICSLPTDADNVFIVLSARALNNNLRIISRASKASSIQKLKKLEPTM